MSDAVVLATAAVVAAGCAAAVASVVYRFVRRRDRRQLEVLLERLNELEGQLAAAGRLEPVTEQAEGPAAVGGPPPESVRAGPLPEAPADVLAGRTSYVRRAVAGNGDEAESLAGQAIAIVHRHLTETLAPADLAGELHISLRTLERGLVADLGCTPSQLIVAMKMREARRLLRSGRYRVNEVASRLGFSSPYHFSRRFKEFYRVAPSELTRDRNAA